jgi:steroid delta-isomerase-like uncharacterized protein
MTTLEENNREVVRRFVEEGWNEADFEVVEKLVAADGVTHDPTLGDLPNGPEGAKRAIQLYHDAFPDARLEIEDVVAEGDEVAVRWTGTGTHEGELMGVEPTGNEVEVSGIEIDRIEDGKIAETWVVYDALGMLRQLGAVPEQPEM